MGCICPDVNAGAQDALFSSRDAVGIVISPLTGPPRKG